MRFRLGARTLVIGTAVVVLAAALMALVREAARNRIVVENRSGAAVESLSITVGGRPIVFGPIPPGGTAKAEFGIRSDDHFSVTGALADGSTLGGDFGYVTNGMSGVTARFGIEPGGQLRFSQAD